MSSAGFYVAKHPHLRKSRTCKLSGHAIAGYQKDFAMKSLDGLSKHYFCPNFRRSFAR